MFVVLILMGDRKDTKFSDFVWKSEELKMKRKLMNTKTQNRACVLHFATDKTIELSVLSNILIISF